MGFGRHSTYNVLNHQVLEIFSNNIHYQCLLFVCSVFSMSAVCVHCIFTRFHITKLSERVPPSIYKSYNLIPESASRDLHNAVGVLWFAVDLVWILSY